MGPGEEEKEIRGQAAGRKEGSHMVKATAGGGQLSSGHIQLRPTNTGQGMARLAATLY